MFWNSALLIPAFYPESMNTIDQAGFLTFPALQSLPDFRQWHGVASISGSHRNGITATGIVPDFHRIPSHHLQNALWFTLIRCKNSKVFLNTNNIYSLKNLSVRKVTGKLIDYQNDIYVWGGWFVRAGGNVGLFLWASREVSFARCVLIIVITLAECCILFMNYSWSVMFSVVMLIYCYSLQMLIFGCSGNENCLKTCNFLF